MKPPPFVIYADTREQRIPPFPTGVDVERWTLDAGDYTTAALQGVGVIERKSAGDYAGSITRDRERFDDELRRLLAYRWRAIVVEGTLDEVLFATRAHPHSVVGTVASHLARSDCATLFVGTPALAGRLIAGILRRWQERLEAEHAACVGIMGDAATAGPRTAEVRS